MAASAESVRAPSSGLLMRIWHSSIGKKYVMAITGLGLYGFVVIHMLGNLQIFAGREAINDYAHALKANPAILWGARFGLLTIVALHITAALQLSAANRKARPVAYQAGVPVASTFAQRSILISGLTILAFILFHLAHFTLGWVNAELLDYQLSGQHDVYRMMYEGFSNPLAAIFYIVAVGMLLLHLSHGVSSLFQSLGLRSKKTVGTFDKLAKASALLLFLGNTAIVLSILFGILPRP